MEEGNYIVLFTVIFEFTIYYYLLFCKEKESTILLFDECDQR